MELRHRTYGHVVGAAAGLDLVVVERAPVEPDGLHAAVERDRQLEQVVTVELVHLARGRVRVRVRARVRV